MIKNTGDLLFLSTITICAGIVVWAFVSILSDETGSQEFAMNSTIQKDETPKAASIENTETQSENISDDTGISKEDMKLAKEAIRKAEAITEANGITPDVRTRTAEQLAEFCDEAPSMENTSFENSSWPDDIWNILNTADYCNTRSPRIAENVWMLATLFFHDDHKEEAENLYARVRN